MKFTIAAHKSENFFFIYNFDKNIQSATQSTIQVTDLADQQIHAVILSRKNSSQELLNFFVEQKNYVPISFFEDLNIDPNSFGSGTSNNFFPQLDYDYGRKLINKLYDQWILHNNIELLDNLFDILNHLKKLWPNDRTAFFEELWYILRKNLGTINLTLIYNDIKKATKSGEKNQLIQTKVEGKLIPNPVPGGELEEKLIKHYEKELISYLFNFCELNLEDGKFVVTANIHKGPILMMGQLFTITKFQKILLSTLFKGLQHVEF